MNRLGTFDPSASCILIKEVRVRAYHLIEECQFFLGKSVNISPSIGGKLATGVVETVFRRPLEVDNDVVCAIF